MARFVAGPQHVFSRLFRPVIAALNTVANRLVRALGVEPAEELASARTPGELVSLARHSALAAPWSYDTADLFVRTMSLGRPHRKDATTPRGEGQRPPVVGHRRGRRQPHPCHRPFRFPVYRERINEIVGMVHLKDALAIPSRAALRTPVGRIAQVPLLVPVDAAGNSRSWSGCAMNSRSPSSSTSTAGRPACSPGRTSSRNWSATFRDEHDGADADLPELSQAPAQDGHPAWDAEGSCRADILTRIGLDVPPGPYETVAGLVADQLGRIPVPGDTAQLPGWRLLVLEVGHHRAERVRLVRAATGQETER